MIRGILLVTCIIAGLLAAVIWWKTPPSDPRLRAEGEHGIHLPPSAANIQCRGDAWVGFLDRGASTLFEMNSGDLDGFVSQLKINARRQPAVAGPGDPLMNGWNVWPHDADTFVPGNQPYGGFKKTWSGDAVPTEMLSCASPAGDFLHVEFWKIPGPTVLVKMFTDWN